MLSRIALCVPQAASAAVTALSSRLLHATACAAFAGNAPEPAQGTPGSVGAAAGRHAGSDGDLKFGDTNASASSGQLYGREDRDPMPSPNPGVTQANSAEMSFPRDEPSRADSEAGGAEGFPDGSGSMVAKEEGIKAPEAYPIQNDPSVPEGAGPELTPEKAQELKQDESTGPKAAGQGVVEGLAKEDPERYGSGRSSPA